MSKPTIPEVQWLVDYITMYVNDLFNLNVKQRKILPEIMSTDYLSFQEAYMKKYKHDDKVTHDTIRFLTEWIFYHQATSSDPTAIITAIKYISPNISDLDNRTMAAVCQMLILTGAGVLPTIPANPALLPYEAGFNITSDMVVGQWALNVTDGILYTRIGNTVRTLQEVLNLQISDVEGLAEALLAIEQATVISASDPLVIDPDTNSVNLNFDPNTLEVDSSGNLKVKAQLGTYISTAIPEYFTNDNLSDNKLIIDHLLNTENVNLLFWDENGNKLDIPWKTEGLDQVVADFGSPIGAGLLYRYTLVFWNEQGLGTYPDPTYSLDGHIHDERYSQLGHLHDSRYSQLGHLHDSEYSFKNHQHDGYSIIGHTHSAYQLKGNYAQVLYVGRINGTTGAVTEVHNPTGITITASKVGTGKYNITLSPALAALINPFIDVRVTSDNGSFLGPVLDIANGYQIITRSDTTARDANTMFKIEIF